MTPPPSSVGATEAVNQEMETIPSQAPSDALSFTPADMCEVDIDRLLSATYT